MKSLNILLRLFYALVLNMNLTGYYIIIHYHEKW
jgi:hypothetical protein